MCIDVCCVASLSVVGSRIIGGIGRTGARGGEGFSGQSAERAQRVADSNAQTACRQDICIFNAIEPVKSRDGDFNGCRLLSDGAGCCRIIARGRRRERAGVAVVMSMRVESGVILLIGSLERWSAHCEA